ncbi:hypothetical protein O4H32_13555, partial [Castellaniella denitrificans]|nr:hypothetical protein [Castellaniella denitrificans]
EEPKQRRSTLALPRWSSSDRTPANAIGPGEYQADAVQKITGAMGNAYASNVADVGALYGTTPDITGTAGAGASLKRINFDSSRVARTSSETRGASARVLPVVLV